MESPPAPLFATTTEDQGSVDPQRAIEQKEGSSAKISHLGNPFVHSPKHLRHPISIASTSTSSMAMYIWRVFVLLFGSSVMGPLGRLLPGFAIG